MLYSLRKLGIEFSTEHLEITENADIQKKKKKLAFQKNR